LGTACRHGLTAVLVLFWLALASAQTNDWAGSHSCRECHPKFYQLWSTSFHGLALQPYTHELGEKQLVPQTNEIVSGEYHFIADLNKGVVLERSGARTNAYPMVQVLGGKNVFYFLTTLERGWLQTLPVAYDVRRREWFDTTASAMRHFSEVHEEKLDWRERPLTFNTSCYSCHVSQLSKNYNLTSDSYHTVWREPGINCETCHGPSAEHVRLFQNLPTNQPAPADLKLIVTRTLSVSERNDLCAVCHAKMSALTPNFAPGEDFFNHFDLVAMESPDFYPDGRDLGENYTFTSWKLSPCTKTGQLDCLHCHTSSGRYRFKDPETANNACLPCHEDKVKAAPAHTHHKHDSAANQCVSCHMPTTEFARMRRSDHSMLPPAPAATIRFQSPNACNLCHTNQSAAWSDKFVRQWHSRDYQKTVLERGELVVAARRQDWSQLPAMLDYLSSTNHHEVFTVSLVRLLANCAAREKWPALRQLATAPSAWVRAAAADSLGERLDERSVSLLLALVQDPYRLVRVRAANALSGLQQERIPEANRRPFREALAELLDSLKSRPDDSSAHYNLGIFLMNRAELQEAVAEFQTSIRLETNSLPAYVNLAVACSGLGQNDSAEAALRRALQLRPTNAVVNLNLGMLLAETGRTPQAEQAFRTAFRSDPRSAQAAYNLGVMLAETNAEEALEWCRKASVLGPENPKYGYTYAYFLYRGGKAEAALREVRRVRERFPHDENSAQLEQAILKR
jgi:tetratricopeptide (TPR) repeat protein